MQSDIYWRNLYAVSYQVFSCEIEKVTVKIYLYLGGLVDHGLYLTCMQVLVQFYSPLFLLAEGKKHHPKHRCTLPWLVILISSQPATDGLQWKSQSASSWGGTASALGPQQKCSRAMDSNYNLMSSFYSQHCKVFEIPCLNHNLKQ